VYLTQAERQVCDLVRALALPLPGFSQLREECVVRGEISLFDDLTSVLRGLQLAHPHRDQVARACEEFRVRRVGTARFLGLFRKECQMGREESIEKLLLIKQLVGGDVDAHHQLEPEDRLAQGAPDGGFDELGTLATYSGPDSMGCLPSQAVEGCHRRVLGQQRGHVGLDIREGMGLRQPAKDELRRRQRALDGGDPTRERHGVASAGKAAFSSAPERCPTAASTAVRRSSNSPTFRRLVAATAVEMRARRRGTPFSMPRPSVETISSRRRIPSTESTARSAGPPTCAVYRGIVMDGSRSSEIPSGLGIGASTEALTGGRPSAARCRY
jgi:hypothetical protein